MRSPPSILRKRDRAELQHALYPANCELPTAPGPLTPSPATALLARNIGVFAFFFAAGDSQIAHRRYTLAQRIGKRGLSNDPSRPERRFTFA